MTTLRERIDAELENIDASVLHLPNVDRLPSLSELELAGVAALLNSFYNGVENILKQICKDKGYPLPNGNSWHRDLLQQAKDNGIVSVVLFEQLKVYMAFRHFFAHAYMLDVEPERMEPLVRDLPCVLSTLKEDLKHVA